MESNEIGAETSSPQIKLKSRMFLRGVKSYRNLIPVSNQNLGSKSGHQDMAPIERSWRALSIYAIGCAGTHDKY